VLVWVLLGLLGGHRRRTAMPSFIMLANFTDQGVRAAKDTTKRYDAFKEMIQKSGVTIKDIYWTLGH
jgi:uncharacterized protein with GYD domain